MTIHYTSNHPTEHKTAACRHLISRTFTLPITEINKEQELNNILIITRNNVFQTQLIQRLHGTMTRKRQKEHNNTQIWVTFTYHISLVRKVTNLFKHTHLSIAYRTTNTVLVSYKTCKKRTINSMQAECIN
jgi:hypothetical protein